MTPSTERLLWRLDAYDRICRACGQSGIAPLRFLAFRPERMRLRVGESLLRSQVPIVFAPDLAERLAALLPPAAPPPSPGPLGLDRDALRRHLALAQLDGDLDPIDVATWGGADRFLDAFASLSTRFFDEAKASGSGEETAALFLLVASSSIRNVLLQRMGGGERFLGAAALSWHLADRALGATVEREGEGLSARLGLLLVAACSPLSFMGAAPAVAARPVNAYRTIPTAYARARDAVRAHVDRVGGLDVAAARARLSAEMLTDPVRRRDLVRAMLAEAVRDLALLSTLTQGSELRDLASSTAALTEALFTPLGADKLRARIERHPRFPEEPLSRLSILVDSVGAVLAGDLEHLARVGSIEQRADLAAAGALLLAFDEFALEQGQGALSAVRPVPPSEAQKARDEGRAYWFGLDDEPLFLLPKRREESFFFVDIKDFTKRTAAIREESMGEFLKSRFYDPILRTCGHLARSPQARVTVVNLLGDAVLCKGDVSSMVALSAYVRRLLDDAARELQDEERVVGAVDDVLKEIDAELQRVERALVELQPGAERDALALHREELRAGRAERLQKAIGSGLEAGVFVTWGREATVIEVGSPEVGQWKVVVAEQLNAAARGTSRSATIARERAERRAAAERLLGGALVDPFFVHTTGDPLDVSASGDFHNAGAALSGEALQAYREKNAELVFRSYAVPRASLPASLRGYWLPREREDLLLCTDRRGTPALLFRFTGKTVFRGLEANGAVDIWEILLVDRGFGRDFVAALGSA